MKLIDTMRSLVLIVLALSTFISCKNLHAAIPTQDIDQIQYDAGERSKNAILKYLVPALNQAGKVGRIYYAADCPPDEGYPYVPYPFPKISAQPPSEGVSGLAAVQEIFRDDKNVAVEEKPEGVVRVKIGEPHDDILQTTIAHITFNQKEQYNFQWAIRAIMNTDEVGTTIHKLGIMGDSRPVSWIGVFPDEGLPHLPDSLTNITMDEALDKVAQTFGGIVVYGTCIKQHYITVKFTGGPGFHLPENPQ